MLESGRSGGESQLSLLLMVGVFIFRPAAVAVSFAIGVRPRFQVVMLSPMSRALAHSQGDHCRSSRKMVAPKARLLYLRKFGMRYKK